MSKSKYAPLPPCRVCGTNHGDQTARDESCAVLGAEKRIAHLYHNKGKASEIRFAQADREEALGNLDRAQEYRTEARAYQERGH